METVSIQVCKDLHSHTEKIKGINHKVNEMNKEITTSSGLLTRMMNLQRRNKLILILFSVLLITTFLVIVCSKFTNSNTQQVNNNANTKTN
jgi:hypothetical protein